MQQTYREIAKIKDNKECIIRVNFIILDHKENNNIGKDSIKISILVPAKNQITSKHNLTLINISEFKI